MVEASRGKFNSRNTIVAAPDSTERAQAKKPKKLMEGESSSSTINEENVECFGVFNCGSKYMMMS